MDYQEQMGCSPNTCESCPGCGGSIEKISLRVEWRHKGVFEDLVDEVTESINALSRDLVVSGVELTFINNTFSSDIAEGTSEFLINGYSLEKLTPVPPDGAVTKEILRKGIFQALLQNI
jgi:hypothetical protein